MIYDNNFRQGMQYDGTNRILNLFSASGDTGGDIAFKTRLGAGSSSSDIGTEKVRIKASGFVGVGYTADPGTTNLFAVNGNSYLNGNLTVRSTGYGVGKVLTSDANGLLNYTMPTGGTVTSVAALTVGTTGTDLSSTVATGTTTPVITLNVPTASAANRGALSAADWSTFNGKLSTLTGALLATGATTGATSQSQAFTIGITTPIHLGGTTTTSPLTLQTTSGVGATGADMHLKVGNNGSIEGLTILNNGNVGVRSTNPLYGLQVGNQLQLITNTDYVSGSAGSGLFIGLDAASGSTHGFMRAFTGGSSVNLGDINIQPTGGKTVFGHNNTARAIVDLKGGTAAAWSAPLKINAGTLMTATEAGAVENDTITHHLYFTPVAGSARVQLDNSAGGSGTVTSISVTTANGVSGTVATATTTPAITLSLGAITPTSVNGAGISTNGNFSGTQNLWVGGGGASATGTGNVSVGYYAGTGNTTGGTNTFIGASAGANITTGFSNVAIGSSALQGLYPYSAYGNCAIGLGALTALTTGNNNIAIGDQAGYGVNGSFSTFNSTSTTSLYIGSSTTPSANGNTNEVVIGNAANGNGSNTATIGNASITNTYIRGLTYDYIAVTTTYTVLMTDHIVNCGGTTAYTITLPSAVTAGAGREFILKRTSTVAGTITIAPVSSQTIDGTAGNNTTLLGTNYNKVHLVSNGTNWLTL